MTAQWSGWYRIAARARVRHRSALLGTALALVGCSFEDRLSLGRHQPSEAPLPGAVIGAAGRAAAAPAGAAGVGTGIGAQADARVEAEPEVDVAEPIAPPVMNGDSGMAGVPHDAAIGHGQFDCRPGAYTAELSCAVDPSMFPPGSQPPPLGSTAMRTTLAFTVQPSSDAQWLEVTDGMMMFEYVGFGFFAQLQGGLDCATETFRAELVDGAYASLSAPFPTSAPFRGALEGRIDRVAQALLGSWWHGPPNGGPQCVGRWMAQPL